MLAISTIYFYSDKEYLFPESFQCGCLLLEAWNAGIRPLPVFTGHWAALKKFPALPWILTITWSEKLVTFFFCLLQ